MPTKNHRASSARAYHHGNLREALVTAGLELLERDGGADFSLREAARAVGVTVNASYRHFRNKEALLAAIAAEGFRRFAVALAAGAEQGRDPVDRMIGSGRAYVDFARHNPALFRLMFGRFGVTGHGEELLNAANAANSVLRNGLGEILGAAPDSPEVTLAAAKAWSMTHGLSHLVIDGQIDEHAPGFDQLVTSVLSSINP